MHIYIYIERERERDGLWKAHRSGHLEVELKLTLNWWMVNTMAENSIKWCSVYKMQLRWYEIQPKGIMFYNNYSVS